MNRILYIMRHGEAEPVGPNGRDLERKLTSDGRKVVKEQSVRLLEQRIRFDGIIASSAPRAWQTAEEIALAMGIPDNRCIKWPVLYSGKLSEIVAVRVPPSWTSVALIGHNPVLSELASYLCPAYQSQLSVAGLVAISFSSTQWMWPRSGKLILQLEP